MCCGLATKSIFKKIGRINYDTIKGADAYTLARHGSDRPGPWFQMVEGIIPYRPFHRTTTGHDHTYFILDFDIDILDPRPHLQHNPLLLRDVKIRIGTKFVKSWLDQHPDYQFFAKISGSGVHLIQRYERRIDPQRMQPVVKHLFPQCDRAPTFPKDTKEQPHLCDETCAGWHYPFNYNEDEKEWNPNLKQWTKILKVASMTIRINVDLKMFERIHMIRWTYSKNMKIPDRFNFAIPIINWDPDWILKHMYQQNLQILPYSVPQFQFEGLLLPEAEIYRLYTRQKDANYEKSDWYLVEVPDIDDELTDLQKYTIEKIDGLLSADETVVPPCVSTWYSRCKKGKIYWGRYPWIKWLANKGYTPEEIALVIRFKVNDAVDNSDNNKHVLLEQLPQVYGSRYKPYLMMGCAKLQFHGEPTSMDIKIADEKMCKTCRRTYPLQNYPDKTLAGEKDTGFEKINKQCIEILDNFGSNNVVVRKATRAGLTTTMIPVAKALGKKLLVVVPTNRIGRETFVKAVAISKEQFNVEVHGAMFAANKNACLILTILNKGLNEKKRTDPDPAWSNPLAWNALRYHSKPLCAKCKYRTEEFPVPILNGGVPVPMIDSEITTYLDGTRNSEGNCAYITLYKQIKHLDVVFITYSKLFALFSTDSDDAYHFRQELLECFDVILLDEVSHLTNHSALSLHLLRRSTPLPSDPQSLKHTEYSKNILLALEDEINQMLDYRDNSTSQQIETLVRKFVTFYEPLLDSPITTQETQRVDNFLEPSDRMKIMENFSGYHELIERAAIDHNISLHNIEGVLFLLNESQWMLSSIPTKFHPVDITLITEPATRHVKRFVREFDRMYNKQVIITDATMPYINMADFFQINFETYEVGDPRGTNKTQLVIADSRNLNIIDLFFNKERSKPLQEDLAGYIRRIAEAHDPKNIMIVAANKATAALIRHFMRDDKIPRMQVTWYRSDLTIGVESDKRIMICICPPYPPKGSHDWLAFYYHLDALHLNESIRYLGDQLSKTSAKIAFYQAIGRAKDPIVRERSVVYCWGISGGRTRIERRGSQTVIEMMDFQDNVPTPYVFTCSHRDARSDNVIKIAKTWLKSGVIIDPVMVRMVGHVRERGKLSVSQIGRIMHMPISRLEKHMAADNLPIFQYLGVEVSEEFSPRSTIKKRWMLRYVGNGISRA